VEEVEQCWRNVFATLGARCVQVDLSAVNFVDTAGGALLARMHEAGFRLAGGGPLLHSDWHGVNERFNGEGELISGQTRIT